MSSPSLMTTSGVSKLPVDSALSPTSTESPLVLIRSSSRSGQAEPIDLVQKANSSPLRNSISGRISQLLMVAFAPPPALLKFAAIYAVPSPDWDANCAVSPWNQAVPPTGWLLFVWTQPRAAKVLTSANPSLKVADGISSIPIGGAGSVTEFGLSSRAPVSDSAPATPRMKSRMQQTAIDVARMTLPP